MNYFDKNVHRNNHQLNKTIIKRSAAVFELAAKFTSWATLCVPLQGLIGYLSISLF